MADEPGRDRARQHHGVLTLFNDTLEGDDVHLEWTLRAGSPTGAAVANGQLDATIPIGTSSQRSITFEAPSRRPGPVPGPARQQAR